MPDNIMTSFNALNYSGMLFNKGNIETPFSVLIGSKRKFTNHVEFVTGQYYTSGGGTQPSISENTSLTAPEATFVTRAQLANVTQIFHESLYDSYAKQSNMGTLNGVNIAGQTANPATEMDFQIGVRMLKIARDIEATFIAGTYSKATTDDEVNKTRGILQAITSNVYNLEGRPLRVWDVAVGLRLISEANAPLSNLILGVDATTMFQLSADAEQNGLTVVPASRTVNGIALSSILTPLGTVNLLMLQFLPAGTVMLFNPTVMGPVEQPVPEKGNFFIEPLAKVGAGTKYQIFGQIGLDYGPEWYHAKFTNISTDFIIPPAGKKIYAIDPIPTAQTLPVLASATLADAQVGVLTDALEVTYTGTPTSSPTLAYQWKLGNTETGAFANISGATSATYTPLEAQAGKYLKVEVTASVYAVGTVLTPPRLVLPAD